MYIAYNIIYMFMFFNLDLIKRCEMSTQLGKLCSMILLQHFGENVQKIGIDLFAAVSKTLNGIVIGTRMSRREVFAIFPIVLFVLILLSPRWLLV